MTMDDIICVKSEIHKILTTLRFGDTSPTSFFGIVTTSSKPQHTSVLLKSLRDLNEQLSLYKSISEFDPLTLILPFVDSLSDSNDSPSLSLSALESIHKFILRSLISPESQRSIQAISCLVNRISKMTPKNEFVQIKRLEVILDFLRSKAAASLTDKQIVALFNECIKSRINSHNSDILVKYSENIISQITLFLFSQINSPNFPAKEKSEAKIKPSFKHGFAALTAVMQTLTEFINPNSVYSSENSVSELSAITFGLKLVQTALESAGSKISSNDQLNRVISDNLCKQLLQNSQSKNPLVLSSTLRVVFLLFQTSREILKTQLEVFITSIHLRIAESSFTTNVQKELVLESLEHFACDPDMIVGIFRNYDCELKFSNLFEEITKLFSYYAMNVYQSELWNEKLYARMKEISANGLLAIMMSIEKKFCGKKAIEKLVGLANGQKKDRVKKTIRNKKKYSKAVAIFNEHGKNSLPFLQNLGIIRKKGTAESMALFLRNTPNLSKSEICSFLSQNKKFEKSVLTEFVKTFDFGGTKIDQALREFLGSLTLQGESQQILRILEEFSSLYYQQNPSYFENSDACYVVLSAIIMLNTDLYNDQIKTKLELPDFRKILQGVNAGKDFPREYIDSIYNSIAQNELKAIPNDLRSVVSDKGIDQMQWQHLLRQSFHDWQSNAAHDHGNLMFGYIWAASASVICARLKNCPDSKTLSKLEKYANTFAKICSIYNRDKILNKLLISLCALCVTSLDAVLSQRRGASPAEAFAQSGLLQAQLRVLSRTVLAYGESSVREAWRNIAFVALSLAQLGILSGKTFGSEDFGTVDGADFPSLSAGFFAENSKFAFLKQEKASKLEKSGQGLAAKCQVELVFSMRLGDSSLAALCRNLLAVFRCVEMKDVLDYKLCRFLDISFAKIFFLDRFADLVERNHPRVATLWTQFRGDLFSLLRQIGKTRPSFLTERVLVDVLRVFVVFAASGEEAEQISAETNEILAILVGFDEKILVTFGDRIAAFSLTLLELGKMPFGDVLEEEERFFTLMAHLALLQKNIEALISIAALVIKRKRKSQLQTERLAFLAADLTSIFGELAPSLTEKSFSALKSFLRNLFAQKTSIAPNRKISFFKKLLKINYILLVANSPFSSKPKAQHDLLENLKNCFLDDPSVFSQNPSFLAECLEQIVLPLLSYSLSLEKSRRLGKSAEISAETTETENTLSEVTQLFMRLIAEFVAGLTELENFEKLWVKYTFSLAKHAGDYFAKSNDQKFLEKFCENFTEMFSKCAGTASFAEYKNPSQISILAVNLDSVNHFPPPVKRQLSVSIKKNAQKGANSPLSP